MKLQLLELDPADNNTAEITCRRIYADLDSPPDYEAISYEWDSSGIYRTIKLGTSVCEISKHLFEAFRALRCPDRKRLLWVDGFGLDQDNPELDLLMKTFSRAKSVIMWLGDGNSLTKTAYEIMRSLAYISRERICGDMKDQDILRFFIKERPSHGSLFLGTRDMTCTYGPFNELKAYYLPRRLSSDDDTIFKFDEDTVWREIDEIFSNSYFGRAWILQEVAAAAEVNAFRGKYSMPWPVFWAAYLGRVTLAFKKHVASNTDVWGSAIWSVRDARERFRKQHSCSDLAQVLATLTYSKKTRPHDHIYAALQLAKLPADHQLFDNQYKQTIEKLFINVASFIINDRNDLFLWGNKSVLSKRTLQIPTWVPEWTGHTDDFATEYFRAAFGRLVRGNYSICGPSLHLDAHILDAIEFCSPLPFGNNIRLISQVVGELDSLFKRKHCTLFGRYIGEDLNHNRDKALPGITSEDQRLHSLANVFTIITRLRNCPSMLLQILSNIGKMSVDSFQTSMLNIEALWSIMNPIAILRSATPVPSGEQLFLAWLYTSGSERKEFNAANFAKGYGYWTMAALVMESANDATRRFLTDLSIEHLSRAVHLDLEDECVFVTRKGYIGRARLGEVREGHVVAILGGGYVPYILEERDGHYALVSHAYVEGLMDLREMPTWMNIQRIGLV